MVSFDADLTEALERLYDAFSRYPHPVSLDGSSSEKVVDMQRALKSAPLKRLSAVQIGPYAGSALLTVGDVADYKHFLPRIIEVAIQGSSHMGTDAPIIAERLKRSAWRTWPEWEQLALKEAFKAAWSWSTDQRPFIGASAEIWLCGIAILGEPIEPVLEAWSARLTTEALLQSALLAARPLTSSSDDDLAYWTFVDPTIRTVVTNWARSDDRLQAFLHSIDGLPEEDRWHINVALDVISFRHLH